MSVSSISATEAETPPEATISRAAGPTAAPSVLRSTPRPAVSLRGLLNGSWLRVVLDAALLTLATSTQVATSSPEVAGQGVWWLFPPLTMAALTWGGRYRPAVEAGAFGAVPLVVASTAVAAVSVVAVATLLDGRTAAGSPLVEVWGVGTAALIVGQLVLVHARRRIRAAHFGGTATLIVGAGEIGVGVERRLRERPELGLRPVGFLHEERPPEQISSGLRAPILGTPLDLERVARRTGARHVIVAFAAAPDRVVAPIVRQCARAGLAVSVVPRLFESLNGRLTLEDIGGLPVHTLSPTNPAGWRFATKHAIDRLAAVVLLVALAPLFAGIAAAIKLFTPCPVFFRQRRVGRDGREFEMWKFSTMVGDAETRGQVNGSWAAEVLGERRSDEAELPDPRTRLGRLLRRTLLDELPQLFNVLAGDMSLVGPRPEQVPYVRRFEERIHRYGERHRVKPGMTGWAQVQGLRGNTALVDRVEADNFYVENWSWWLDLKILAFTAVLVLRSPSDAPPNPRGTSTAGAPDSSACECGAEHDRGKGCAQRGRHYPGSATASPRRLGRLSTVRQTTVPAATDGAHSQAVKVSIVMPCLNEAGSVGRCVRQAKAGFEGEGWEGEVIVADNGSEDGSAELARAAGALVVHEPRRGYGSAYLAGFAAAQGDYIVMADADQTYDLADIPRFVAKLEEGDDLVVGNRMRGIQPGGMPWLHRYIGNPVLTGVLNLFFGTGVRDAHCGMRAVRREALPRLDLRTTGMEFASEMVIRARKEQLAIAEIPIRYHLREGESKLSSVRDGWRHLRFLLVHSPTWLFMVPGALMCLLGALISLTVLLQIEVFGREWGLHTMVAGALLMIVGTQVIALGVCAHAYGSYFMGERDPWFDRLRARFRLEHGLLLGGAVLLAGLAIGAVIAGVWLDRGFGALSEERVAMLAAALMIVGIEIFFSSFLVSIIGLRRQG